MIRLKVAAISKENKIQRKYAVEKLQNTTTKHNYVESLKTSMLEIENTSSTQEWNTIKSCFITAADKHLGHKETHRKQWISDDTWNIISERRKLKGLLNNAKTRAEKARLRCKHHALDKSVKKSAREDKRRWFNNLAREAEISASNNKMKDLYRITNQITKKNFGGSKPLRNSNGELVTSKREQIEIWTEHYSSLLSNTTEIQQQTFCNCNLHTVREDISSSPPEIPEIVEAIHSLKNSKAPGLDNIPPELLKASPEISANLLFHVIRRFWNTNQLCEELKEGAIINIPKKGDLTQCKNWRGITLINMTNKVIAQIINKRLTDAFNPVLRNEQAGFRPQRSCIDHVNSLRIIIEQSVEWRSPLYLTFIDFEKAFDTLAHSAIWSALACKGTPQKIIDIIKALYRDASCRILHEGCVSRSIHIKTGVRQGCVLSPLLFNLVLDSVMQRASATARGITWGLNKQLEDLDYADDICLLTHRQDDMQAKLNLVQLEAAKAGLRINILKTKVMRTSTSNSTALNIGDQELEDVSFFCYLGSILTSSGGSDSDIKNRLKAGNQSFGRLNLVWRDSNLSLSTKLNIFNACVKSTLLYGCESWNAATKDINAAQTFINRCLRRILKIFWPITISNARLWQRTKQTPIGTEIKRRKWRWIGHTLRKPDGDISKTAIEWNPQGSRRRGRPCHTWRRQIEIEAASQNKSWREIKQLASDRPRWRKFVMAL